VSEEKKPKNLGDQLGHIIITLIAFFVAILLALAGAEKVAAWLVGHKDEPIPFLRITIGLGTGTLALTVLVATAKDVVNVLSNVPAHFRDPKSWPVIQDSLKIFCAVAALFIAQRTLLPQEPATEAPIGIIAAVSLDDPEPMVVFPILYEENGSRDLTLPNTPWTKGVKPDADRIAEILALLKPCTEDSRPYPIAIQVVGYASSKEFGDPTADDAAIASNLANVELANLRTHNTADEIQTQLKALGLADRFWVSTQPDWADYETMVSARPVLDRFVNAKRTELENWTRRADIRVLRAGTCTRRDILERTNVIRRAKSTPTTIAKAAT
jgi:hypothetical protein